MRPSLRKHVAWAVAPLLVLACSGQETEPVAVATVAVQSATPAPTQAPRLRPTPSPEPASAAGSSSGSSRPEPYIPDGPPPRVDVQIASVSLDEVVFDTFGGGYLPLSQASDNTIEQLRDVIRPIYQPVYDPVEGGGWLGDDDLVIGYASKGDAYAYPLKILNYHEIVNDYIDGVPLLVSYCPLCASAVVYERELDGDVLLFGNTSALHESDMVMYDHQTGSYWFQVVGEGIVGALTGKRLKALPSVTIAWGEWKRQHPDTLVLSKDLGLLNVPGNPYLSDPFAGYARRLDSSGPPFPISPIKDARLRPGAKVFAIEIGESHKAYALMPGPSWLLEDAVGGEDVLIIGRGRVEAPGASAYFREVDGRILSFGLSNDLVEDEETGSVWDDSGLAVSGPLAGTQLDAVPSRTSFWFSLVGALPGIELHKP
jgi:hypothetical protein